MKRLELSEPSSRILSRAEANNCALINQLATPGLGSLLARRYVAGIGQLLLAVAGFLLVLAWFVLMIAQLFEDLKSGGPGKSYARFGELGGALFVVAWFWALATSLSVVRQAKPIPEQNNNPGQTPPPIPSQPM